MCALKSSAVVIITGVSQLEVLLSLIEAPDRAVVETTRDSADPLAKAFARHETFHVRYGWLKKGFDLASASPEAFLEPDAAVRLGVGKNMVRAIRYWCRAFKLTGEMQSPDRPRTYLDVPTSFGRMLLADQGWDPYLENPASLWLLHWKLLQATCFAPTWFAVFNGAFLGAVTDEILFTEAAVLRDTHPGWSDVVDASLHKDVDCLLRMYAPRRGRGKSLEDSLDSPFAALRLLAPVESDRHLYTFNVGPKDGLADEVILFAMMEYLVSRGRTTAGTAMLSSLAYDEGSPGRVFRLAESDLSGAIERLSANWPDVELADVAGSHQLMLHADAAQLSNRVLESFYGKGDHSE